MTKETMFISLTHAHTYTQKSWKIIKAVVISPRGDN